MSTRGLYTFEKTHPGDLPERVYCHCDNYPEAAADRLAAMLDAVERKESPTKNLCCEFLEANDDASMVTGDDPPDVSCRYRLIVYRDSVLVIVGWDQVRHDFTFTPIQDRLVYSLGEFIKNAAAIQQVYESRTEAD